MRRKKKAASGKEAPAQKAVMTRKRAAELKKRTAKKLALGPMERADYGLVNAARRLWLSAESMATPQVAPPRKPTRKTRTRVSR